MATNIGQRYCHDLIRGGSDLRTNALLFHIVKFTLSESHLMTFVASTVKTDALNEMQFKSDKPIELQTGLFQSSRKPKYTYGALSSHLIIYQFKK